MEHTREFWVDTATKIAEPILRNLANDSLKINMPIEHYEGINDRAEYTYLEALGRTLTGLAPWLEVNCVGREELLRSEYADLARKAISNAVNPNAMDCMNFENGYQPIVDAAFLAHAILRSPNELFFKLQGQTKEQLIAKMQATRNRKPGFNNWLLFSGIIEAFLKLAGVEYDKMRIDYAVKQHEQWYKGDGIYGDGPHFHMDYYNSFVIQPMLCDLLKSVQGEDGGWDEMYKVTRQRHSHYATYLENMIAPDGSYPVLGRSSAYRFGAFQSLAHVVLDESLENEISYEQVRCGLTAMIKKITSYVGMFDEQGWLKIGVCGSQPSIGESYISTGSLYLCMAVFLPLGLNPSHQFWSGEDKEWSSVKIWSGKDAITTHSII